MRSRSFLRKGPSRRQSTIRYRHTYRPAYTREGAPIIRRRPLPISERLAGTSLSLPIDPFLDEVEQNAVIEAVSGFFHKHPDCVIGRRGARSVEVSGQSASTGSRHSEIEAYTEHYLDDYGFESNLVAARQELILEILKKELPRHVIEVGCGSELLYRRAVELRLPIDRWVIVEPSRRFADLARQEAAPNIPLQVIEGFFEDIVSDPILTSEDQGGRCSDGRAATRS